MIFTLLASISEKIRGKTGKNVVEGHIIRNYKIKEKWQNLYDNEHNIYDLTKENNTIKTVDGYFPTNLTEVEIRDIDINKEIYFNIER